MSSSDDLLPKLRNVTPMRVDIDGVQAIALRDPLQLTDTVICVAAEAIPLLAAMDGTHSVQDIQAVSTGHLGRLVLSDEIEALVEKLDEACLLENGRFKEALRMKTLEFRNTPFRPPSHAGASYSADPTELRSSLDGFFTGPNGPGTPDYFCKDRIPAGLIVPHIDVKAGGPCFAHGYKALGEAQPADIYVIFGTGHSGVTGALTATNLDFETPLGRVRTDHDFVRALEDELGQDPCEEELLHVTEHVIEFQTVFLQHTLGGRADFSIVPILVSVPVEFFMDGEDAYPGRALFDNYCAAIRRVAERSGKSVCYMASADLDHIGPRYGDPFMPDEGNVRRALESDREMLSYLERLDVRAFVEHVSQDNDSRRICGFSPIMAMLSCMDAQSGAVLDLDYTFVDDKNSFVSYCSVLFI